MRLRRLPHAQTDLRAVYGAPDVPAEAEGLARARQRSDRPSLLEIARAGSRGPEAMIALLERELEVREGL